MRTSFKLIGVLYKPDLTGFKNLLPLIFLIETRWIVSIIKEKFYIKKLPDFYIKGTVNIV